MSSWFALHHCDLYLITSILPLLPLIFLLSPFSLLSYLTASHPFRAEFEAFCCAGSSSCLSATSPSAYSNAISGLPHFLNISTGWGFSSLSFIMNSAPAILLCHVIRILINLQPVYHALIIPVYICKAMVVACTLVVHHHITLYHIISYPHHLQPLHRYVGIFGNADPLDIAQWFSVATSVPTPTRRFDPRTGVCSNMFTGEPVHPRTSLHRIQQRISLLSFDFTSLPCTPLLFILFYLVPLILTTPYAPLLIDHFSPSLQALTSSSWYLSLERWWTPRIRSLPQ